MKALTPCWFTRIHLPRARPVRSDDGTRRSHCRHCDRPIISWDRVRWFPAEGFNVTQLAETVGGRFLFVLDTADEMVIARHPVGDLPDEAAVDALKTDLRVRYGIDAPGATLELFDSAGAARAAAARPRNRASRPAPASPVAAHC